LIYPWNNGDIIVENNHIVKFIFKKNKLYNMVILNLYKSTISIISGNIPMGEYSRDTLDIHYIVIYNNIINEKKTKLERSKFINIEHNNFYKLSSY